MAKKKEQKKNKTWIFIAIIIALAALFALAFIKPTENMGGTAQGQGQGQQTTSTELIGDTCKRDLECFLANCKSTPSVVECVNSTHQETYSKQCKSYTDVNVVTPQDFTKCGCVQGVCKIK